MKTVLGPLKPKPINIKAAIKTRKRSTDDEDDDDDDDRSSSSSSSSGYSSIMDDPPPPWPQPPNGLRQPGPPPLRPNMVPPKHLGMPGMMTPRPPPRSTPPAPGWPRPHPPPGATRPPNVVNVGPCPPPPPQPLLVEGTDHRAALSPAQKAGKRNEDLAELTDEECMLAAPWVRGFDMTTKDWGECLAARITQVFRADYCAIKL